MATDRSDRPKRATVEEHQPWVEYACQMASGSPSTSARTSTRRLSGWFVQHGDPVTHAARTVRRRGGLARLLEVWERYGVMTSVFAPGHSVDTFPEVMRRVVDAGHEVGHHGYYHENPTKISGETEKKLIQLGLNAFRNQLGVRPLGYRAPFWEHKDYLSRPEKVRNLICARICARAPLRRLRRRSRSRRPTRSPAVHHHPGNLRRERASVQIKGGTAAMDHLI